MDGDAEAAVANGLEAASAGSPISLLPNELVDRILNVTLRPGDRAIAARVCSLWRDHVLGSGRRRRTHRNGRGWAGATCILDTGLARGRSGDDGDDSFAYVNDCIRLSDEDADADGGGNGGQCEGEDAIDRDIYDCIDADDPGGWHGRTIYTAEFDLGDLRQRQLHRRRAWANPLVDAAMGEGDACRLCGDASPRDADAASIDPDAGTPPPVGPLPQELVMRASALVGPLAASSRAGRPEPWTECCDRRRRLAAALSAPAAPWPPSRTWRRAHGWPGGEPMLDWALDEARCPARCLFMAACAADRCDLLDLIVAFGYVDAHPHLCPECATRGQNYVPLPAGLPGQPPTATTTSADDKDGDGDADPEGRGEAGEKGNGRGWTDNPWPHDAGLGPAAGAGRPARALVRDAVACAVRHSTDDRVRACALAWLLTGPFGGYPDPYVRAARYGRVAVLAWLRRARAAADCPDGLRDHPCHSVSVRAAERAAAHGRVSALRWLVDHAPHVFPVGAEVCASAARGGRWRTVRWLRTWTDAPWDQETMRAAALRGEVAALAWLHRQGCPSYAGAADDAIAHGHLPAVEWLVAAGYAVSLRQGLQEAAYYGQRHVLRWAIGRFAEAGRAEGGDRVPDPRHDQQLWRAALRGGRLTLAHDLCLQGTSMPVDDPAALAAAAGAYYARRACFCLAARPVPAAVASVAVASDAHPPDHEAGEIDDGDGGDDGLDGLGPDPTGLALAWLRRHRGAPREPWSPQVMEAALARHATLRTLRWLRRRGCHPSGGACVIAAAAQRPRVVRWLVEEGAHWRNPHTVDMLVRRGMVATLRWLFERSLRDAGERVAGATDGDPAGMLSCEACENAAIEGHSRTVRWLRETVSPPCPWGENVTAAAAEGGHLALLRWLRAPSRVGVACPWDARCYHGAAFFGHLGVMEWLLERRCPVDDMACVYAAKGGQVGALRWLRRHGFPWHERACAKAAARGCWAALRWMRDASVHGDEDRVCPWTESTLRAAADHGHWAIARWALERGCPCSHDSDLPRQIHERMAFQAGLGIAAHVDPALSASIGAELAWSDSRGDRVAAAVVAAATGVSADCDEDEWTERTSSFGDAGSGPEWDSTLPYDCPDE